MAPGSVIQFFTTPTQFFSNDTVYAGAFNHGATFGVTHRIEESSPADGGGKSQAWDLVEGSFGAVSGDCMFVSDEDGGGELRTKVDVGDSFLAASLK